MNVPARLAAFAAALALTFAASYAVGAAVDPVGADHVPTHDSDQHAPAEGDGSTTTGPTTTTGHDHAEDHGG